MVIFINDTPGVSFLTNQVFTLIDRHIPGGRTCIRILNILPVLLLLLEQSLFFQVIIDQQVL
jgi:hypothetical protein